MESGRLDERRLRSASRERCAPSRSPFEAPRLPRFVAGVDGLAGATLRGWAIDLREPRAPVTLALEAAGRAGSRLSTTSEHRADIGAVLQDNVAGFSLDLAALELRQRRR